MIAWNFYVYYEGSWNDEVAKNLTYKLNIEVCAPTKYLWATEDGNYFVAGKTEIGTPNWSDLAIFKVFTPGND